MTTLDLCFGVNHDIHVLIFKTDISTEVHIRGLKPALDNHPAILEWSVDTEDVDNVLRIEGDKSLSEREIIYLIRSYGFYCEVLTD